MAKGIKTGGRKAGTKNKTNAEREKAVAESGMTPLNYMLSVLRDEEEDPLVRMDAAKSVAPYVHPKLAQIEHSGKGGKDLIPPTDPMDIARRVAFMLSQAINKAES